MAVANSTKGSIAGVEVANSLHADFVAADVLGMTKMDASSGFNSSLLSQALPPIGTPPLKIDAQPDLRSHQTQGPFHHQKLLGDLSDVTCKREKKYIIFFVQ